MLDTKRLGWPAVVLGLALLVGGRARADDEKQPLPSVTAGSRVELVLEDGRSLTGAVTRTLTGYRIETTDGTVYVKRAQVRKIILLSGDVEPSEPAAPEPARARAEGHRVWPGRRTDEELRAHRERRERERVESAEAAAKAEPGAAARAPERGQGTPVLADEPVALEPRFDIVERAREDRPAVASGTVEPSSVPKPSVASGADALTPGQEAAAGLEVEPVALDRPLDAVERAREDRPAVASGTVEPSSVPKPSVASGADALTPGREAAAGGEPVALDRPLDVVDGAREDRPAVASGTVEPSSVPKPSVASGAVGRVEPSDR